MIDSRPITFFLFGTFTLSLLAFALMYAIPEAQNPEGLPGLPVWIIAVWSPSTMAMIMAYRRGNLTDLWSRVITVRNLGQSWVIVAIPIFILVTALILSWRELSFAQFTPGLVLALIGLNLFLGPLGEELGWRGFLLPELQAKYGWLIGTLLVSMIWAVWHTPLWTIASPQSEIPLAIFFVHVLAYGFLIACAQSLSPHSLLPAVLLHLLFNVSAGVALLTSMTDTASWYILTAFPYAAAAVVVTRLVRGQTAQPTLRHVVVE